jgi:hypothetical protein
MLSNLGEPITVVGTVFCLYKLTAIKNTFLSIYLLYQVNSSDKKLTRKVINALLQVLKIPPV